MIIVLHNAVDNSRKLTVTYSDSFRAVLHPGKNCILCDVTINSIISIDDGTRIDDHILLFSPNSGYHFKTFHTQASHVIFIAGELDKSTFLESMQNVGPFVRAYIVEGAIPNLVTEDFTG
jgi:hypothetical protein